MNLTGATTLEDVAHEVKQCQEELGKLIDDYEHEVRRVEKMVSILSNPKVRLKDYTLDRLDKSQML